MTIESLPRTERYEFDPALRDESAILAPRFDRGPLARMLGRVALDGCRGPEGRTYWRDGDRLSADDIDQLEAYFAFLRAHYGIPESQSVFPKREAEPPRETGEPEGAEGEESRDAP